MRQSKRRANKDRGFTMIELVIVVIVLLIFSAVALSTYRTITNNLMAEMDGLKVSLRFAQIKAMNDTVDTAPLGWGIFPNSTSYTLVKNNITATSNLPDDNSPTHTLATGVTVTVTAGGVTTVAFNEWGAPINAAGVPVTGNITLTLTKAGEASAHITVTKNTGFIQ